MKPIAIYISAILFIIVLSILMFCFRTLFIRYLSTPTAWGSYIGAVDDKF